MRFIMSLMLLTVSIAQAGNTSPYNPMSGEGLLSTCENYGKAKTIPAMSRKQGVCEGYIFGVVESMPSHCIPEETEKLTIVETVRSFLKRDDELSISARDLVEEAVKSSWSCPSEM
jgi:hypothetical protein